MICIHNVDTMGIKFLSNNGNKLFFIEQTSFEEVKFAMETKSFP